MTLIVDLHETQDGSNVQLPTDDATPVLARRSVRDDLPNESRFGDDLWNLSAAVFEAHAPAHQLDWISYPAQMRQSFKEYIWAIINIETDRLETNHTAWSIATIRTQHRQLRSFALEMAGLGRTQLSQVEPADLDRWVTKVQKDSGPLRERHKLINAVRSLWEYRELVPDFARLQSLVPWNGRKAADLLGPLPSSSGENRTPRVDEMTMTSLLSWSIAIVDQLAEPITIASRTFRRLRSSSADAANASALPEVTSDERSRAAILAEFIVNQLRTRNLPIPGLRTENHVAVDRQRLSKLINVGRIDAGTARLIEASGHPLADTTVLHEPVFASVAGMPLEVTFPMPLIPTLERLLWAACLVVISYLSGMRPGEVLNLERGCVRESGRMQYLVGKTFKNVFDDTGAKDPEGKIREVPWVVCAPVVRAVKAMERLHDNPLLFASTQEWARDGAPRAVSPAARTAGIMALVQWVNERCAEQGRADRIPDDPNCQSLYLSRFRRTLAWHIARRPQGIVAASIQYGHVGTQMTQGYAGTLASGFPDEHSFEAFLERLETLGEAHTRLLAGEHVSGPAAPRYRARVTSTARFEGITVPSNAAARRLLNTRDLQVIQGDALSCVYDPARALCSKETGVNAADGPHLGTCRSSCTNIARTDRDIDELLVRADDLRTIISDPLCPPIRHERERAELDRLTKIITVHMEGKQDERSR